MSVSIGCRSIATTRAPLARAAGTAEGANDAAPPNPATSPDEHVAAVARGQVHPVAYLPPVDQPNGQTTTLLGETELALPPLVDEVLARNASLQAMAFAARAAAERFPQAIALDDPMLSTMWAPGSFDSAMVEGAYALQGSQKFPWHGKRAARGRAAQAEAGAAQLDVEDERRRLIDAVYAAYFEYFLVARLLDLNRSNADALRQFRDIARKRYEARLATQQDILQADVELAEIRSRELELERIEAVASGRINTLLREPADAPLPAPPETLPPLGKLADLERLQSLAVQLRPDLAALAARTRADQAAVVVAAKEFYPDVEVYGRYDTFWQPADTQGDLRGQMGVNLNMPLYQWRRRAAVREAMARLSQRQAEYAQRLVDIEFEVHEAYAQADESRRVLGVFRDTILPAAEQNVAAARANYVSGEGDFFRLIDAQRRLIALQMLARQAEAEAHRRTAALERATGMRAAGMLELEAVPPPRPE